ncbi:MAG TPA: hypothetical protein VFU06_08815 [Longimicrobiales bacterium]|nr:hypothetical protein [Longimicrobiales bacterium]
MQRTWILGLAAVTLLAACDDDPTGTEGDSMTRVEAQAVASNVFAVGEAATTEGITEVTETGEGSGTIHFTQTSSHPCPQGGSVQVSLNIDVDYDEPAQAFELDATGALTHDGCAVAGDDAVITFDGDPNLQVGVYAAAEGGVATTPWTNSVEGAFTWAADDGREGRCVVDLFSSTDFVDRERTLSGEVCGHTIQQTVTWQ